jgi:integrase
VFYFLSDITQNDETTIGNKVETEKRKLLNALDKVCEKYNLPAVNFNCMRHTFATHAYFESKCDLYSVCQALGHTDIKTTQNYLDSIVLSGDKNPITKATESLISKFLKDEHAKRD